MPQSSDINIRFSESDPQTTGAPVPDFPWIRFDSGQFCYNEALIEGRYLFAGSSALGRPMSRAQVWAEAHPRNTYVAIPYPWHPRSPWESAFRLCVDGQLLTDRWQWVAQREIEGQRPGCRGHETTLRHQLRPIEAKILTTLDGTSFLTRRIIVTNTGKQPALISEAFTWSGRLWNIGPWPQKPVRTEPPFEVGSFTRHAWGREGNFQFLPAPVGLSSHGSVGGASGWSQPFVMLRNRSSGEIVVIDLAFSGNWSIDIFNDDEFHANNRRTELFARAGISGPAPLRVLEPGESAELPAVHFGHLFGDLDAAAQMLHQHLRRSTIPALPEGMAHPVASNHYGYTEGEPVTDDYLLEEIDIAAEVGADVFVVDAGWFGDGQGNYQKNIGDWNESPLLKRGLLPISQAAHQRGMRFGLWMEPERMSPTSRLATEHPDWFLRRRGYNILQLDLAKPQVEQHVLIEIVRIVETYQLDLFRLDYNILQVEGGEREIALPDGTKFVENTQWRYYDALYRIFDSLRQRFPRLLIENCSSGGQRNDLGMLSRSHWSQSTDNWDPQNQLKILNGTTLSVPPEQVMVLLGSASAGVSDLDFMLRIGLFGHFCACGIYPGNEQKHAPSLPRWRHAIQLYKTFIAPFLHRSRIYHHTPVLAEDRAEEWCVLELAADNASRAVIGVWRLPEASGDHYLLRPRGLDLSRRYRLTYDNTGQKREVDAAQLVDEGLAVPVRAAGTSELLLFDAV